MENSKNHINVCFAGLPIGISSQTDSMQKFCRDYISDKAPLFAVEAKEEDVLRELSSEIHTTKDYAECLCIYREIAEIIPLYDRVVFHGAAIEYGGKAYIFTAPSGTGKSTHISLWKKYLGEQVGIINGDKPILQISPEGVTVWGTPYAGKENWQSNTSAPLGGICVVSRGKTNAISETPLNKRFLKLYMQTYKPKSRESAERTLSLAVSLCNAPCFSLSCDISRDAVKAAFEALTGEDFETVRNSAGV